MATSARAKIQIETGQSLVEYAKMTDSGDHQIFSLGTIWSGKSGFEPVIRPNGMVAGRNVLGISAGNDDTVAIAGFTAYVKGVEYTVTATTETLTRGTGPGKSKIISVTMDCAGALAIVPGAEGASAAFSATRGAAGGPPYVPVSSVEIGQIRTTLSTPGEVTAAEIFQVVGTHTERFDSPDWEKFNLGNGSNADTSAEQQSHMKLSSALPVVHTGDTYKDVYVQYYTPIFSDMSKTLDFVPAEKTQSVASTAYYNGSIASASEALGAGAFTALLTDGVSDALVAEKNQIITVKMFPDRNKTPYILSQGALGLGRTFPVGDQNQAAVTIAAENESVEFIS